MKGKIALKEHFMVPDAPATCRTTVSEGSHERAGACSGNFHTPALKNVIEEMGVDRVMFYVDYPYETNKQAAEWFDTCGISESDREKIGRTNAERLFKLKTG